MIHIVIDYYIVQRIANVDVGYRLRYRQLISIREALQVVLLQTLLCILYNGVYLVGFMQDVHIVTM